MSYDDSISFISIAAQYYADTILDQQPILLTSYPGILIRTPTPEHMNYALSCSEPSDQFVTLACLERLRRTVVAEVSWPDFGRVGQACFNPASARPTFMQVVNLQYCSNETRDLQSLLYMLHTVEKWCYWPAVYDQALELHAQ